MRKMNGMLVCVAVLAVGLVALAEPGKKEMKRKLHVPKPFAELNLTDDQKASINEIHNVAETKIREIREKEKQDIKALLTPEQINQLEEMQAREEAARQAKKMKKQKDQPATKPAE